jgi:hypothetical protein
MLANSHANRSGDRVYVLVVKVFGHLMPKLRLKGRRRTILCDIGDYFSLRSPLQLRALYERLARIEETGGLLKIYFDTVAQLRSISSRQQGA